MLAFHFSMPNLFTAEQADTEQADTEQELSTMGGC